MRARARRGVPARHGNAVHLLAAIEDIPEEEPDHAAQGDERSATRRARGPCPAPARRGARATARRYSRYTRRAVPAKSASFSAREAPEAMRLKAFHSAA